MRWRCGGGWAAVFLLLSCQDGRSFQLEREDPDSVYILATVGADDRLLDLRVYAPGEAADDPIGLGPGGGQLVTLELSAADLVWALPARPVSVAELAEAQVRRSTEAPSPGRGQCGRCAVPSFGRLQQVTPGDRCLPLIHRARLYRPEDGELRARGPAPLDPLDQATVALVQAALRIDWPGECATPPAPATDWSIAPISPVEQLWPTTTFAQTVDGTVGVFGRQLAGWFTATGDKAVLQGPELPFFGEPLAAIATSSAGAPARFVVFSREGGQTRAHLLTARPGGFAIADAVLEGPLPYPELLPKKARWHGDRAVIVGAFLGAPARPAILDCQPTPQGLSCSGPLISPLAACPGADPLLVDYTLTPRGIVAASADTFYFGSSLAEDVTWSCGTVPQQEFVFDGPIPAIQSVEVGSLGALGERVYACVQPPKLEVLALLAFDADPALGPFGPEPPVWSQIYRRGDGRCGELLPWPVDGGETIRLDASVLFLERRLGGGDRQEDWQEFVSFLEAGGYRVTPNGPQQVPVLRLLHRTPGWSLGSVGWFIEPSSVGAGLLIRPDRSPWRLLWDVAPHDDLGTVVARRDDALLFNAFTDALPLHLRGLDGAAPVVERLSSLSSDEFMLADRESIVGAIHEPLSDQVYVFGNRHVPSDDSNDRRWTPFIRTISRELDAVTPLRLPLSVGDFLCDAALLEPGRVIVVGGSGALLEVTPTEVRPIPISFDDPETAEIEEPPVTFSDDIPRPHLYSVSAAAGVAWAVGRGGLILRIRPERDELGSVGLVAERVALDRIGPEGLDHPLDALPYFSHVIAAGPNTVYVVAQRRPYRRLWGCAQVSRDREPGDRAQVLVIEENSALNVEAQRREGVSIPRRLLLRTAWSTADATLPEVAPTGAFLDGDQPVFLQWSGELAYRDRNFPLPFAPLGADRSPNGTLVIAGPNGRIAIGRPTP